MVQSKIPKLRKSRNIIIVGAGAAGLACAEHLRSFGYETVILEARDRVGGRIRTYRSLVDDNSIELGAEFIHGTPSVIFDRLRAAHLPFVDVADEHLLRRNGGLKSDPQNLHSRSRSSIE